MLVVASAPVRFSGILFLLAFAVSCAMPVSDERVAHDVSSSRAPSSPDRGLLASGALDRQPMKAVYFFPGEQGKNAGLFTTHPADARDERWNSQPATRGWVLDNMLHAHVNTIVMSYWSDSPRSSPMALDSTSLSDLLDAIGNRRLVVLPAVESAKRWNFADEFPMTAEGSVAPGFIDRIGDLVDLFRDRMGSWAKMYDRDGVARYAVNIVHAASNRIPQVPGVDGDAAFAAAFDIVAAAVETRYGIRVGFTLDAIQGQPYSATPQNAAALESTRSVLAIQDFEPEVWSGVVKMGPSCRAHDPSCAPYDNNIDNLGSIVDWKRTETRDWVKSGVPVILSVSNGMDGRYVWAEDGVGFWGDNHDYTDDRFRNWVSEMKGDGVKGITFDTWNGYTEGYAAVRSTEHGDTVYAWLRDLLRPDPRSCTHVQYENGAAAHRVIGSICRKWVRLGGDRRFGAPRTDELPTAEGRVTDFAGGGSIYWSRQTHAHEVHGMIARTYRDIGGDASCLGLPTSDEAPDGAGGRISRFERGVIMWSAGHARGTVLCGDVERAETRAL